MSCISPPQPTEDYKRLQLIEQEALQLAKEGAEASTGDHRLELHAYHSLARAHINTEKLQVLRLHLDAMQADLEAAVSRPAGTAEGGTEATRTGALAEPGPKQQPGNGGAGLGAAVGTGGESQGAACSSGGGGGERVFRDGTSIGGSAMMEE
ncbi:hypothetical protein Vretimale_3514 [Volvox reticuliferus]|uniref:Uncharacterized protein n=1 Tax=Volvox reticuliferus TaxID=1737510 RepID=A0A8J4G1I6_9CHLO|nr:hypothetical protein Vretifemale_1074 [Volvox reticuliferus]GIL97957.1 hypothetical protein Vretimale_3514 [Volvox reticuliferus]